MATEIENINFLDLACIFKIQEDTTLERFGSTINASVFDAANISGGLKQKGLIDFTAYYPGPNSIMLSDVGKKLKVDADTKSAEATDALDDEILRQMSGGKRYPAELATTLNLRSRDLAFRLWKLFRQGLVGYELKNGTVELMLTEQGFLKAKAGPVMQVPKLQGTTQQQMQPAQVQPKMSGREQISMEQQMQEQQTQQGTEQTPGEIKLHGKPHTKEIIFFVLVIIAAAAVVAHFYLKLF